MYVITGATGNTGKIIASTLLEAGKKVRIVSRGAEKAKELTARGAELFHEVPMILNCLKTLLTAQPQFTLCCR